MMREISNHYPVGRALQLVVVLSAFLCFEKLLAQPPITLRPVITSNLTAPMQIVNAGDASGRIFVAERAGRIKAFQPVGTPQYSYLGTFLDFSSLVGSSGEGGLLSIVFHPGFASTGVHRGELFAFYTDINTQPNSDLILRRYRVSDPVANTPTVLSTDEILRIPHPNFSNHNGGEIHFGPDGFLYMSVGDGGGGGDPNNNAQRTVAASANDKSYLLGKMLRIDVNNTSQGRLYATPASNPFPAGAAIKNEVFDYGLRNPFRWSFDRLTGDMWIGDVGQDRWEEIDFRPAASVPGVNYGWNCYEGEATYNTSSGCNTLINFAPAYVYDGQSVIGGVFYRGTNSLLAGYYIGADYVSGNIHLVSANTTPGEGAWTTRVIPNILPNANEIGFTDIGEAENGDIYITGLRSNSVYLVASTALPVKLTAFSASKSVEGAKLKWQTAAEENFSKFEIEYASNQKKFEAIGTVYPSGNRSYEFTHAGLLSGNSYYRLKMIDQDNSFRYSGIISLQTDESAEGGFVRPSLVNSGSMNLLVEGIYHSFELVGTNGFVFHKQNISGTKGAISIPVNKITSGMYVVRLISNENVKQQKILIIN